MARATDDRWVLLPGTLCTPEVFAPVLDYLGVAADKRHVVEVDKPHVEDYAALLRAQVADGAVVCGFSLGAMVLAHNLDALARARAVVLLACNPSPDPKANRANREALRDRVLAGGARDWVRESWQAMSAAPNPELREHVAAMADTTSHLIAAQTELAVSRPGAADQLAASPLPLVFVNGTKDQLTPPDRLRPIMQRATRATLQRPDGLGHFALLEAPKLVANAITDGLNALRLSSNTES